MDRHIKDNPILFRKYCSTYQGQKIPHVYQINLYIPLDSGKEIY